MRKEFAYRTFVCFLCASQLMLMGGFLRWVMEAQALSTPVGEMLSRGDVKYEVGGNAWKKVEDVHVPLFQGMKVKTEAGTSIVSLANNSQLEMGQNSLLTIIEADRLHLSQGSILFRIPALAETNIKVGTLFILRSLPLQASKKPGIPSGSEEGTIGSIAFHSNGSVTVNSEKGSISVLSQERSVIATLSSRESLTIPSFVVTGKDTLMAQADTAPKEDKTKDEKIAGGGPLFMGLSTSAWTAIFATAAGIGGMGVAASNTEFSSAPAPACP